MVSGATRSATTSEYGVRTMVRSPRRHALSSGAPTSSSGEWPNASSSGEGRVAAHVRKRARERSSTPAISNHLLGSGVGGVTRRPAIASTDVRPEAITIRSATSQCVSHRVSRSRHAGRGTPATGWGGSSGRAASNCQACAVYASASSSSSHTTETAISDGHEPELAPDSCMTRSLRPPPDACMKGASRRRLDAGRGQRHGLAPRASPERTGRPQHRRGCELRHPARSRILLTRSTATRRHEFIASRPRRVPALLVAPRPA